MSIFSRDKKEEPKKAVESKKEIKKDDAVEVVKNTQVSKSLETDRNLSSVIIKPRVTEKAVSHGSNNVYTFVVAKDATKYDVRDAIISQYKVTPVKVNIVNKSPRQYMSRSKGRKVTEKGMKKAYIYLKAGDSIELA